MGLMEAIAEEEKQLEAAIAAEDEQDTTSEPTGDEPDEDTTEDEDDQGAEGAEDDSEDDQEAAGEDDQETDDQETDDQETDGEDLAGEAEGLTQAEKNNLAAQLRKEKREKLRVQQELAELRAAQQAHQTATAHTETPAPKADVPLEERVARMEQEHQQRTLQQQAIAEFNSLEAQFAAEHSDYEAASAHMLAHMQQSVRNLNPGMSPDQVNTRVQKIVLTEASKAAQRGQNPIEVLYQMAYDHYGFQPQNTNTASKEKAQNKINNLKNVAKNKRRSATPLKGGGQTSKGNATIEEAANMSMAEFQKLTPAELDAIMDKL